MTIQDSLRAIDERAVSECADPAGSIAMRQLVSICHSAAKTIDTLMEELNTSRRPQTMLSYSLHDKIVKQLESKLHDAHLERERARAERDEAKANRKYAPPMIVRFNHQAWEDGEYVVTLDGDPVGGSVSPDEAKSIVRWIGTAWAELIEHNTMKHRNAPPTVSGLDAFGNAVIQ